MLECFQRIGELLCQRVGKSPRIEPHQVDENVTDKPGRQKAWAMVDFGRLSRPFVSVVIRVETLP